MSAAQEPPPPSAKYRYWGALLRSSPRATQQAVVQPLILFAIPISLQQQAPPFAASTKLWFKATQPLQAHIDRFYITFMKAF
ncbi:hypothetical protein WJX72_005666 [[Myrmecia] bisecta]|uniref:Uncharacterized protein n=1 Tax=[Myrmecia] bisecta TaxID=41462 RepID=A0AAW1Q7B9_9CHLO